MRKPSRTALAAVAFSLASLTAQVKARTSPIHRGKHLWPLLAACLALPVQSQMISQLVNDTATAAGVSGEGQSFTATVTKTIKRISVRPGVQNANPMLYLYTGGVGSGLFDQVGTPAYTQASQSMPPGAHDDPMQDIVLTTPFPVVTGGVYTFVLKGTTGTALVYQAISGNPYPGGQRVTRFNDMAFVDADLAFQIWTTWTQTLAFTSAIPAPAYVGGQYTPAAQATSLLAPEFSIDPASSAVCALASGVVSFIGIGTCTVRADQPGNDDYDPAPQVLQSFAVGMPPAYSIGGNVSGLMGAGLMLQNNGGDDKSVGVNGVFSFDTAIAQGGSYSVTVATQPMGQSCSVSNSSGTANANVTNVQVNCVTVSGAGVQPVPTLDHWGLLLLSSLAGLLGWRKRKQL